MSAVKPNPSGQPGESDDGGGGSGPGSGPGPEFYSGRSGQTWVDIPGLRNGARGFQVLGNSFYDYANGWTPPLTWEPLNGGEGDDMWDSFAPDYQIATRGYLGGVRQLGDALFAVFGGVTQWADGYDRTDLGARQRVRQLLADTTEGTEVPNESQGKHFRVAELAPVVLEPSTRWETAVRVRDRGQQLPLDGSPPSTEPPVAPADDDRGTATPFHLARGAYRRDDQPDA